MTMTTAIDAINAINTTIDTLEALKALDTLEALLNADADADAIEEAMMDVLGTVAGQEDLDVLRGWDSGAIGWWCGSQGLLDEARALVAMDPAHIAEAVEGGAVEIRAALAALDDE